MSSTQTIVLSSQQVNENQPILSFLPITLRIASLDYKSFCGRRPSAGRARSQRRFSRVSRYFTGTTPEQVLPLFTTTTASRTAGVRGAVVSVTFFTILSMLPPVVSTSSTTATKSLPVGTYPSSHVGLP